MRLAAVAVAVVGAVLLAAIAYAVAPPAVQLATGIAVYGASLATAGFVLNGRQAIADRSDLQAEITVTHYGAPLPDDENAIIQVRFYNAGRRPVRVEDAGFWADRSREARYAGWDDWSGEKFPRPIPKTLPEGESVVAWTWPGSVAHWYARHQPVRELYAKPAHGKTKWWALPERACELLIAEWPAAQERLAQEERSVAARAGQPIETDDYGQPVDGGGQPLRDPEPRAD